MEHDENSIAIQHYIYKCELFITAERQTQDASMDTELVTSQPNVQTSNEEWTVIEHKDILMDSTTDIIDESDESLSKKLQEAMNNTMIYTALVPEVKMNDIEMSLCCNEKESCQKDMKPTSLNCDSKNPSTQKKQPKCTIF